MFKYLIESSLLMTSSSYLQTSLSREHWSNGNTNLHNRKIQIPSTLFHFLAIIAPYFIIS